MLRHSQFNASLFSLTWVTCFVLGCDHHCNLNDEAPSPRDPHSEVRLVDRLQRQVSLAKLPQRIVSLAPATTELMFAIGAGDLLVGVTDHCNYPLAATKIAKIGGGTMQGISHETIVSLKPELILGKWDTHQSLIEPFANLNIPLLAIGPDSLAQLYAEATLLGLATGHVDEAADLISTMKRRVARLTAWVELVPRNQRRRVFYEVWDQPLMTAGPNSFIGELLEMGGMKNIFDDANTSYPRISDEVLLDRNPEVILAPATHAERVSVESFSKRQGWAQIRAIQDKQVFLIDGDKVSRCGPRMLDALEDLIRAVYPDKLPPNLSDEVTIR